jgi:uncharacterized protein YfdQ (DUF2303 family)
LTNTTLDGAAVKEIRDLAQVAAEPSIRYVTIPGVGTIPIVSRSDGAGKTVLVDIYAEAQKWRDAPIRRTGTGKAFTISSFIDIVKRHADEHSVIFASIASDKPSLTAVLDYHKTTGEPRFGSHRFSYEFPLSNEWKAWKENDGRTSSQLEFAQWVEDHIAELASPYDAERAQFEPLIQTTFGNPNEIARIARGLQINVESKVSDIRTLQSGEAQISFEEVHRDGDGKPLKVPGLFMLSVPLFIGGDPIRVPARLRYRKSGASLSWAYHLYRWQDALRNALVSTVEEVAKETSLPVYEGEPEA